MPDNKKKKQNKSKKVTNKVAGFDERRVEKGGKEAAWKTVGKALAKTAVSGGMDAVSRAYPTLLPIREAVRAVTGFDERRATGGSETGGPVVRTMNAPVAFARNQVQVGMNTLKTGNNFQRLAVCDLASIVETPAVAGYGVVFSTRLSPILNSTFPNFYTEFEEWEKWRPVECIMHYTHFAPTSSQCAVAIAFNEDVLPAELANVTQSMGEVMALGSSAMGSCYEDFSLVVKPPSWQEGTWFYCNPTVDANYDLRLNFPGTCLVAVDASTLADSTATGYLYIELVFEVSGRRSPFYGSGLLYQTKQALAHVGDPETRSAFMDWALGNLKKKMLEKERGIEDGKANDILREFKEWQRSSKPVEPAHAAPRLLSQAKLGSPVLARNA